MSALVGRCTSAFGRTATRIALVALALGLAALGAGMALGHANSALAALAASWLFFAGVAAGALALSAAIRLSRGRWAESILPIAEAGAAFLVPAWALLVLVVALAPIWMSTLGRPGHAAWAPLAARDLIAAAGLVLAGRHYARVSRAGGAPAAAVRAAVLYLLVYAAVLSLLAIDLVMGLADWAPSTVLPPLTFMGGFLGGIAWPALVHAIRAGRDARSETLYDLGKLLFAFSIFWGYLIWAAYLPTWYGNLPDETGQLLARWHHGFRPLSLFVLCTVFAVPFLLFLPESFKRRPATLGLGATSILAGLCGERFLMVLPSVTTHLGGWTMMSMFAASAAMFGLFVLVVGGQLGMALTSDERFRDS